MKAIRVHEFGDPEVMRLEEVPDPQPAPGQVVVRVEAAGVNPVDTYIRAGTYKQYANLPYTPGMDGAGRVDATGDGVTRFKPGDRVYIAGSISGTYAERTLCEESQVHPLPEKVDFVQGAGVNVPYATAYRALFQLAHAAGAETVLIHGASGGVGLAAIQLARAAGLSIIGTAGSEDGLRLVADQGAHHVLDHRQEGYLERAQELTGGQGVDLLLEMLANVNLGHDLKVMASRGRVVIIGSRGTVEIDPRDAMARELTIFGMVLMLATPRELQQIHAALVAGLENGTLRPFVGRQLPLGDAAQTHREIIEGRAYGKIVLLPGG